MCAEESMRILRVWHPVLIGLTPILSAYMTNRHEVRLLDLVTPVALMLALIVALWTFLTWALKDIAKAGLVVSVFLFCFLNFDGLDSIVAAETRDKPLHVTTRI